MTLVLNYAWSAGNPWSYHLVNAAAHVLAALALFGIVRRTLELPALAGRCGPRAAPLALTIALLWMVHPLQTESVTYVIQRAESFMGLFYLLALYCLIRGHGSPHPCRWYAGAVASGLLGVGCKEVIVTLPVVALAYDSAVPDRVMAGEPSPALGLVRWGWPCAAGWWFAGFSSTRRTRRRRSDSG